MRAIIDEDAITATLTGCYPGDHVTIVGYTGHANGWTGAFAVVKTKRNRLGTCPIYWGSFAVRNTSFCTQKRSMKKHDSIFYRVMQIADSSHSDISAIDAIEFRREAYGFTREEMAKILGMRPSHYSEFVARKISLPKRAALRAITIGVPPLAALNDTRT